MRTVVRLSWNDIQCTGALRGQMVGVCLRVCEHRDKADGFEGVDDLWRDMYVVSDVTAS